jgi:hypothetical protein
MSRLAGGPKEYPPDPPPGFKHCRLWWGRHSACQGLFQQPSRKRSKPARRDQSGAMSRVRYVEVSHLFEAAPIEVRRARGLGMKMPIPVAAQQSLGITANKVAGWTGRAEPLLQGITVKQAEGTRPARPGEEMRRDIDQVIDSDVRVGQVFARSFE